MFAQGGAHDAHYFAHPKAIVSGRVNSCPAAAYGTTSVASAVAALVPHDDAARTRTWYVPRGARVRKTRAVTGIENTGFPGV
jgi:hypothetical protein